MDGVLAAEARVLEEENRVRAAETERLRVEAAYLASLVVKRGTAVALREQAIALLEAAAGPPTPVLPPLPHSDAPPPLVLAGSTASTPIPSPQRPSPAARRSQRPPRERSRERSVSPGVGMLVPADRDRAERKATQRC